VKDPTQALLGMHLKLNDLLQTHYHIHGRWWLGVKRLMKDLKTWDKELATTLEFYVREIDISEKFKLWQTMTEHILKPIGGPQKIEENNCDCKECKIDLHNLLHA
jgi:hypothetical protein